MNFWFKKKAAQPLAQQSSPIEDAQRHAQVSPLTYKKGKNTVIYLSREDEEALHRAETYLEELRRERENEDDQSGWGPGTVELFATMAASDYKPDHYLVRSTDSSPLYFDNNSNPASGQVSPVILDDTYSQYSSSLHLEHHDESPPLWGSAKSTSSKTSHKSAE